MKSQWVNRNVHQLRLTNCYCPEQILDTKHLNTWVLIFWTPLCHLIWLLTWPQPSITTEEKQKKKKKLWKVICQVPWGIFGSVVHLVNAVMLEMQQDQFHVGQCFQLGHMTLSKWRTWTSSWKPLWKSSRRDNYIHFKQPSY